MSAASFSSQRLEVEAVTPDGRLFSAASARLVELPTTSGELGILPGHAPLMTVISAGELRIHDEHGVRTFIVAGGFALVGPGAVQMLLQFAADEREVSESEAACQRARAALEAADLLPKAVIDAEVAMVEASLARVRAKHRTARKAQC